MFDFCCRFAGEVKGKVIQRFPSKDRKDATFPEGLELVGLSLLKAGKCRVLNSCVILLMILL